VLNLDFDHDEGKGGCLETRAAPKSFVERDLHESEPRASKFHPTASKSHRMAPSPLQQRRTHNTLMFQKLLNLRDGASPFTLVLDSLEQSGGPVVREFARRAKV
jgi:hypothetical protein